MEEKPSKEHMSITSGDISHQQLQTTRAFAEALTTLELPPQSGSSLPSTPSGSPSGQGSLGRKTIRSSKSSFSWRYWGILLGCTVTLLCIVLSLWTVITPSRQMLTPKVSLKGKPGDAGKFRQGNHQQPKSLAVSVELKQRLNGQVEVSWQHPAHLKKFEVEIWEQKSNLPIQCEGIKTLKRDNTIHYCPVKGPSITLRPSFLVTLSQHSVYTLVIQSTSAAHESRLVIRQEIMGQHLNSYLSQLLFWLFGDSTEKPKL